MNDALQRKIELLIDGELSPEDETRLLARIDGDCDAWKQLGMSFLEDRLLRRALSVPVTIPAPVTPATDRLASRRRGRIASVTAAALVACVAFVTGRMTVKTDGVKDPISVAGNSLNDSGADALQADVEPPARETTPEESFPPEATEWVSMELVGSDDVPLQNVVVPLWESDHYQEQIAARDSAVGKPVVAEEIRRLLAARGRLVDEGLTLVPIQLDDGRTGVIPISNISVRAAPLPAIQ